MEHNAAVDSQPILQVDHMGVRYGDLIGVSDVSLTVKQKGSVCLLGANGAGKTTTLKAIVGLLSPFRGVIRFEGSEIQGLKAYEVVRRGLTLAPEGWQLFLSQGVEDNLRLGATVIAGHDETRRSLDRVYDVFPRLAERRRQRAGTLSGGERQMLAVSRALMSQPRLLMLDEPSLGLAPGIVERLYDVIRDLHRDGLTILIAEQIAQMALQHTDYGYVLKEGKTVLEGKTDELGEDPAVRSAYLGI